MKIGILTFHNSRNYGAVLQAYGLKEVLRKKGHHVDVIDYRSPTIEDRKKPFTLKHFKDNPKKFILLFLNVYLNHCRKVRNFSAFERNYLNVTEKRYYPVDIQKSDYDIIIIGSDQVWSSVITGGPDPVYWGAYKPENAKLLTYAASSNSLSTMENDDFSQVNQWLDRFNAISVREERLKDYVETHSKQNARVVVDPTLLAGRDVFEKITPPRIIKEPYVLLYTVESTPAIDAIIKKVASLYQARIIRTGSNALSSTFKDIRNGVTYKNASVQEFLSLIKYAECVVALSFHGTALSLLYEKDFYSVKGGNMARVESVLNKCHLSKRMIDTTNEVAEDRIDYTEATAILKEMQNDSMKWLEEVLND